MTWEFEAPGTKGTPAAKLASHFLPWEHSMGLLQPDAKHGTAGVGVGAGIRPRFWGFCMFGRRLDPAAGCWEGSVLC